MLFGNICKSQANYYKANPLKMHRAVFALLELRIQEVNQSQAPQYFSLRDPINGYTSRFHAYHLYPLHLERHNDRQPSESSH